MDRRRIIRNCVVTATCLGGENNEEIKSTHASERQCRKSNNSNLFAVTGPWIVNLSSNTSSTWITIRLVDTGHIVMFPEIRQKPNSINAECEISCAVKRSRLSWLTSGELSAILRSSFLRVRTYDEFSGINPVCRVTSLCVNNQSK